MTRRIVIVMVEPPLPFGAPELPGEPGRRGGLRRFGGLALLGHRCKG